MSRRPKYNPKTDENHNIVPDFIFAVGGSYRGYDLDYIDISKTGGRRVDYIIAVGDTNIFIEVKTPEAYATKNHGMTDGEQSFFRTWPGRKAIVDSFERLEDVIICAIDEME